MKADQPENLKKTKVFCAICLEEIETGKAYPHQSRVLCEACCIDIRTPLVRKSHWQYLVSIKADYLIPASKRSK